MIITNVGYNNVYLQEHWDRQRFNNDLVFYPTERAATSVAIDGNSVLRNSASAVNMITPVIAGTLISGSAVLGGVLGVPIGISAMRDSYIKGKAALNSGDAEGVGVNALYGAVGASYAGVSGVLAADGVLGLMGSSLPAAMTPALGGVGLAMYGALLAYGSYGLKQTYNFNRDMQAVLKTEGEQGVLNWLNHQVTLTKGEVAEIYRTAKDPDQEIAKRLQKKWNALEFRTSPDCASLVREKLPGLLEKFDQKEASVLIEEVEKNNFKARVKNILFLFISVIGIAGFIALLLSTGPAAPILFALSAIAWLAVDSGKLHNYIGGKCWIWHLRDKKPEVPCQTQPLVA